jgi:hypothetical protein
MGWDFKQRCEHKLGFVQVSSECMKTAVIGLQIPRGTRMTFSVLLELIKPEGPRSDLRLTTDLLRINQIINAS